jgi:acetyl-CoA C-acetyltransferase
MPNHEVAPTLSTRLYAVAATTRCHPDVTEVHDFFTAMSSISYEGRGFAEQYGDCKIVEAGITSIGGDLPVNMSGGLTAPGHPLGASGVTQRNELARSTGGATAAAAVATSESAVAHGG